MQLDVFIEIMGLQIQAGIIEGSSDDSASFRYSKEYLQRVDRVPISMGLPLQDEPFSPKKTRIFFEALLPEGFSRRTAAAQLGTDAEDYLSMLSALGSECIGAVQLRNPEVQPEEERYEELSPTELKTLAEEDASKSEELNIKAHLALAGATGKTGFTLREEKWYLPMGGAVSSHIVKQRHVRFDNIVLNELLCIYTAKNLGIEVPETFVIGDDHDSEAILITSKRFDRTTEDGFGQTPGTTKLLRLHQEDFSQVMGIPAANKYEKEIGQDYLKRMFDTLRSCAKEPEADEKKLWQRLIFNYFIGNTDCHVKNSSFLYSKDLKSVRLAPLYDVVCTLVYGETSRAWAFNIDGKYRIEEFSREAFKKTAKHCDLDENKAMGIYDDTAERFMAAMDLASLELSALGFSGAEAMKNRICSAGVLNRLNK